ncbi:MAG: hypothetical protein K2Z80_23925 [Xanthobacteraceae bacterium]|nr:hypothetical protein [Xanthobacteraceae bacterium]
MNIAACGWDPVHRSDAAKVPADIVNLGYVLNVLADPGQQVSVLTEAWSLARRLLVVAVPFCRRPVDSGRPDLEQRRLVDTALQADSLSAGLGIRYVFRHRDDRDRFLASVSRRHRRFDSPLGSFAAASPLRLHSSRRDLLRGSAAGLAGAVASLAPIAPAWSESRTVAEDTGSKKAKKKYATCEEVATAVTEIIAEHLGVDRSKAIRSATLKQLGGDSLDLVELVMAYEDEFGVEIADDVAETMTSVGGSIDVVCRIMKLEQPRSPERRGR